MEKDVLLKTVRRVASGAVIAVFFVLALFPMYWLLVTSLKPRTEIFSESTRLIPHTVTLDNYGDVYERTPIFRYFTNSMTLSVITVVSCLFIASLAAYAVSRYRFRGRKPFFLLMLSSQMLPLTTLIIPLYMIWSRFKLLDSYVSILVTYAGFFVPVAIWLLTSYFQSIPRTIDEAAIIDGCGVLKRLFSVILPLAMPGVMAAGLTVFISAWQELMISMTFLHSDHLKTIPAGVISFISHEGIQWGGLTAAGVIACIPILLVFLVLQKALISGLTEGAIKG